MDGVKNRSRSIEHCEKDRLLEKLCSIKKMESQAVCVRAYT